METSRRTFMQLTGGLLLAGCGSSSTDPNPAFNTGTDFTPFVPHPAALSSRLEADVQGMLVESLVPGINVGIWTPRSSWVRSFGLATVNPDRALTEADIFSWRSVTKSMTVTLLLQLLSEQNISLDSPVSRWVEGMPREYEVSLRQLAGMSSGLTDYIRVEAVQRLLIEDPLRHYEAEELIRPALAQGFHFPPGTQYEYCNLNTLLLGVVVEKLSGQSMAQAVQNRIFTPLGMTSSVYLDGVERPAPATQGYTFEDGQQVQTDFSHSALGAAGATAGPLQDARLWAQAVSTGSLISGEMHRQRLQFRDPSNGPIYDGYGLGMGTVQGWLGHTGEGAGYALAFFGEPNSDSQLVILMNGSNVHDQPQRLMRRLLTTLGWPVPTPTNVRP